ncbi:MAG: energy-coupling factor ABC transporter ATP-binding protein [Treponema sp.]|jgi:energy-coupling factor transport system ATP-binding protein|nr:energy-coupling factor ABC transporter ATP-binding protein [Treponema sp.]
MAVMIEIKNCSFAYTSACASKEDMKAAIQNINLRVEKGECILLCGRSGCGKTTLTRLVNGLIPYFYEGMLSGETLVAGKNICETPMYEIAKRAGSVFQNPRTQFFNVDTDSEIAFGMENLAWPPGEIARRLEQVSDEMHIRALRGRNIFALSGGEKQKIAFASIYAVSPDVYVLDEPSANLDLNAVEDLRRHLVKLKAQGKTILIAEHRLYYLTGVADRVIYMEKGHIENAWPPSEFARIPDETRREMGLREWDLNRVIPADELEHTENVLSTLQVNGVDLAYKKQPVLKGITFEAFPGEVIAITGQNGAGKSTLSWTLCGLRKESGGALFWRGEKSGVKRRQALSYMIMQDVNYQMFAESVEKECGFGLKNPDSGLIQHLLEDLELYQFRSRHPNTLSAGQKQRLAVAAGIAADKELLVFDEPTSGLDYDSMRRVAMLIRRLGLQKKLVFVVTHDVEFIAQACTRVLHLEGRMIAADFPVVSASMPGLLRLLHRIPEKERSDE